MPQLDGESSDWNVDIVMLIWSNVIRCLRLYDRRRTVRVIPHRQNGIDTGVYVSKSSEQGERCMQRL